MSKNPNIQPKEHIIIDYWLEELENNPQFANDPLSKHDNLTHTIKLFLNDLSSALSTDIPSLFCQNSLEPLLKLWHEILKKQSSLGHSTKDIAMMIFSLKSSIIKLENSSQLDDEEKKEYSNLNKILDVLGLMTFELYTAEKERLINRQVGQIEYLQNQHHAINTGDLIGESPAMKTIFKAIGLVLENDITVLLEGESGTGKDLIATVIHQNSKRKNHPFIAINCGAIPKDLLESELFGYEKGAFTGADQRKLGKFELAQDGTLFLDEVSELALDMQVKLLRVLQNQEIERVGGTEKIKINVRIIAASNQDLKKQVDTGKFRLDLYYRLNVFPIQVPPLRERKDDILPLAQFFLDRYSASYNMDKKTLSDDAKSFLVNQKWEGNIRELENLMQRAVILAQNNIITSTTLQLQPGKADTLQIEAPNQKNDVIDVITPLEDVEKASIISAIKIKNGNLRSVANALGISRTTLYNKLKKYNIPTN